MLEVYIRGNTVKYLRLPDEVLEKAREYEVRKHERRNAGRGGYGGGDAGCSEKANPVRMAFDSGARSRGPMTSSD